MSRPVPPWQQLSSFGTAQLPRAVGLKVASRWFALYVVLMVSSGAQEE